MKVYIIIEDRTNRYGNEDTSIWGVYKEKKDAAKELERIKDNPVNKTGKAGEVKKTCFCVGNATRYIEDFYVHHRFECGFQSYRIEEHELK